MRNLHSLLTKKEYLIVNQEHRRTFKDEEIFQGLIEKGEKHLKNGTGRGYIYQRGTEYTG